MRLNRRTFGALLATTALLALPACGSDDEAGAGGTTKVTFGYIGDFNGTSLLAVADGQKLWAKHGIEVTTKVFTNGPVQIQALGAGDLDFGYIGPGAFWLPASGRAKVVAINTLGNADRVIAQPGITSIAQLKGKKVAVPEGTSGDMILSLALKSAGLTNDDIERVPMEAATVVSAFASGQVDAAGIWYPLISTIKAKKPGLVELAKNEDFTSTVSFPNAFVAGNDVVAKKADTVTKVVQVLREANDYRAAHPTETIAATATMLKLDVAAVTADAGNNKVMTTQELDTLTKDGTITKWLTGMNEFFVSAGKLPQPVEPSSYYLGDVYTGAAGK
jgi:NitT/TauT family transport system substrate-binding protein